MAQTHIQQTAILIDRAQEKLLSHGASACLPVNVESRSKKKIMIVPHGQMTNDEKK
jgi:hypothetical protein